MVETIQAAAIGIFLLLLAVQVICYGFDAALENLNTSQLREDAEENKKSALLLQLAEKPDRYFYTFQLIMLCIYLAMCYYVDFLSGLLIGPLRSLLQVTESDIGVEIYALLISALILILVILTFGIMLPRRLGKKYAREWAYAFVRPAMALGSVFSPITRFSGWIAGFIGRIWGIKDSGEEGDVTEEEILSMVNEGHEQGVLCASEAEMISNIFEFSDKEAKDVMTHRSNIIGIDGDVSLREAVSIMLSGANSRYPVYIDNIDHIIGIIHFKDACRKLEQGKDGAKSIKSIRGLVREVTFIPETRNINLLFQTMQSTKDYLVIVSDEYGQTSGLITMEDILEEIVGNIFDEYDAEEAFIEQKGKDCYEIDGLTPLDELGEELSIDFSGEEFETLNGLMISYLERIPEEGDEFDMDYQGYNFKVLSVENKIIKRVLVSRNPEEQKGEK
ncbi:MAG: HlyC/CorC family transporter [Lachnospiraceae bacterium]|nr:HlyC/CorC family transporter [Lachnospiraceae bacterium]